MHAAGLQAAALAVATPVPVEPRAIAGLLATITRLAVAALGGRDGLLVLAEDAAWRDLVPGSGPGDGSVTLDHTGTLRRAPQRPGGATRHVLTTGQPAYHPDTRRRLRFGPYPQLVALGIRSLVIVPLRAGGEVVGALGITFTAPGALRQEDRGLLELYAAHAAAALERIRLVDAERRRADQAERLAETLARVGAAPDLEGAVGALLGGAISLLGGDHGVALVFAPRADERPLELTIDRDGRLELRPGPPVTAPGDGAAAPRTAARPGSSPTSRRRPRRSGRRTRPAPPGTPAPC